MVLIVTLVRYLITSKLRYLKYLYYISLNTLRIISFIDSLLIVKVIKDFYFI